jgi:hypothetical protein
MLGAVPHLVRLLESKNEVIAEGASETLLHIVTPSEPGAQSHPSQTAFRAAGAIPSLLGMVSSCAPVCLAGVALRKRHLIILCTYHAQDCLWLSLQQLPSITYCTPACGPSAGMQCFLKQEQGYRQGDD